MRIHGKDACQLPWPRVRATKVSPFSGHHTVANLWIGNGAVPPNGYATTWFRLAVGAHKYQVLDGMMDDIRVWKTARTQQEIQDHMCACGCQRGLESEDLSSNCLMPNVQSLETLTQKRGRN